MGGIFGVVSQQSCVFDLFFGVDYHSHLGTRRGGMAVYDGTGFNKVIHNIQNSPFRTKFEYDVEQIIRIGSCGAYSPDCKLFDVILAQGACTNSSWSHQYGLPGTYSALSDFHLLNNAYNTAKKLNINVHVGNILSSDIFYNDKPEVWKNWARMGVLAVEMESYALFCIANSLHKKALTILTVSDSFITPEVTTSEQREKSFTEMMKIALEIA